MDMSIKEVTKSMISDRIEWRRRIHVSDLKLVVWFNPSINGKNLILKNFKSVGSVFHGYIG